MRKDNRDALLKLMDGFSEAFDREDIDDVMSYFAEDAVYDEFHGIRHVGKTAIREALIPQFRHEFGKLIFHFEDQFVEVGESKGTGKIMFRWLMTMENGDRAGGWRGLDPLHFKDGLLTHKLTYAKAKTPVVDKKENSERIRRAIDEGVLIEL